MGLEISTGATQQSQQLSMSSIAEAMSSGGAAAEKAVAEIAPLLSAAGNVTVSLTGQAKGVAAPKEKSGGIEISVPELDEPYESAATVDLAALLAYMQLDNDEAQLQVSKTRIEALKGGLEADHLSTQQSIENSIDKAAEAEETAKRNEIFGYIMMFVGIALSCIGGLGSVLMTSIVTLATVVMDVTGASDKMMDHLTDSFKAMGLDQSDAELAATITKAIIQLVCSMAIIVGGGAGVNKWAGTGPLASGAKAIILGLGLGIVTTALNTTATVHSATVNEEAEEASAAVKEAQGYLKEFQTRLDDENEQLRVILQKMNDDLAALADVLGAQSDCNAAITSHIGG